MKAIKMEIKETGKLAGTAKWVAEILSRYELKIGNTKDGSIAIMGRHQKDKAYSVIVFVGGDDYYEELYYKIDRDYHLYSVDQDVDTIHSRNQFFDRVLTSAAESYVWDFITLCKDALIEFLDEEQKVPFNLEIKKTK